MYVYVYKYKYVVLKIVLKDICKCFVIFYDKVMLFIIMELLDE